MEQKKTIGVGTGDVAAGVFLIQRVDPFHGQLQQRFVLGKCFLRGITKIRQQAEMEVSVAIGEEADLQRLNKMLDRLRTGEHRRNDNQRARRWRNASREVHSRQRVRRHQQGCQPVRQCHTQLAGGQQREDADQQQ